jgi:hypothetical protein
MGKTVTRLSKRRAGGLRLEAEGLRLEENSSEVVGACCGSTELAEVRAPDL